MSTNDVHILAVACAYVILHGNGDFEGVIKLRILRGDDYPEMSPI